MAQKIELSPWDRYAILGKSGTGKTSFTTVLAAVLSTGFNERQRVMWVQTKDDPKDLARLRAWGYRRIELRQVGSKSDPKQFLFLKDVPGEMAVSEKIQRVCRWALRRKHVVLVLDEYAHAIMSSVNAGFDLRNLHKTGRGAFAGLVGLTQEPAYIPRQLFSQSCHLFIFRLTHIPDIKTARTMLPEYDPDQMGRFGFWYRWIDGPPGPASRWRHYRDTQDWLDQLGLARLLEPGPESAVDTAAAAR